MKTRNEQSLFFILALLDSNYIKGIKVSSVFKYLKQRGMNVFPQPDWSTETFRNLEQWQKAERVEIDDLEMLDIEDVLHFETVKGRLRGVLMEDLGRFVNTIFNATTNPRYKHYYIIGTPFFMNTLEIRYGDSHDYKWYFSTPGNDTVVELFVSPNSFRLRSMVEDVEQGREIHTWVDKKTKMRILV